MEKTNPAYEVTQEVNLVPCSCHSDIPEIIPTLCSLNHYKFEYRTPYANTTAEIRDLGFSIEGKFETIVNTAQVMINSWRHSIAIER